MALVSTSYNNFSRAKIDHDMMGRYDLPIYNTGADLFDNFISNFKGNAIYRTGFESIYSYQDCEFIEFRFKNNQNYLCVFSANKIRFLSYDSNGNFGWVLNVSAAILEVATPYTLAQCKELDYSQNADRMVITHNAHAPRSLTRISANSFTLKTFTRVNDPFATFGSALTITGITKANPGVVTTSGAHGLTTGQNGNFAIAAGMTELDGQNVTVTVLTSTTFSIAVDTTNYTTFTAGTFTRVLTSDYPACCLFYKGRLYYANTPVKPTTVFASVAGTVANNYDDFTTSPVTDASALIFTLADIAQPIEWLFAGDNSLIVGSADGIVPVNGGGVGNPITAATVAGNITSVDATSPVTPIRKDALIFYVAQDARHLNYFKYDLLSESFKADDANFISYDITRGGLGKIRYKKDKNNLIYSICNGNLLSLNFNEDENIVGWHRHKTNGQFKTIGIITDNAGKQQLFALVARNGTFYIEHQTEYVEFIERSEFFSGTANEKVDADAHRRFAAEQMKKCNFLDNSLSVSNLQDNIITFDNVDLITATTAVFSAGSVGRHIVYKTITGYESGRYLITQYLTPTTVKVQVLQNPTALVYQSWYLTFQVLTGLDQFNGQTVGVVTDGGYKADYFVTGGTLDLGEQASSAIVGYRYKGIIKSFCLGFQVQGINTQATMKAIARAGIRTVSSAGGKFGSSLYRLEPIQELGQNDLNYLPPVPMDGTKYITYTDDNAEDKFFYIVQEDPSPFTVCSIILDANYST